MFSWKVICYNGSGLYGTVSSHLSDSYWDADDDCVYVVTDQMGRFWREFGQMEERFGLTAIPVV